MSQDPKSPKSPEPTQASAKVVYRPRRGMMTQAGQPVADVKAVRARQRSETTVDGGIVQSMAIVAAQHEQEIVTDSSPSNSTPKEPEPETVIFASFDPTAVAEESQTAPPLRASSPRHNRTLLFVIVGAFTLAEVAAATYVVKGIRASISNYLR